MVGDSKTTTNINTTYNGAVYIDDTILNNNVIYSCCTDTYTQDTKEQKKQEEKAKQKEEERIKKMKNLWKLDRKKFK